MVFLEAILYSLLDILLAVVWNQFSVGRCDCNFVHGSGIKTSIYDNDYLDTISVLYADGSVSWDSCSSDLAALPDDFYYSDDFDCPRRPQSGMAGFGRVGITPYPEPSVRSMAGGET